MRLTGYNNATRSRFDVEMTPMIDVVFQLLIFFVCTVSFQQQEQALAATPKSSAPAVAGAAAEPVPQELEDLRQVEVLVTRAEGGTVWTVNGDACTNLADVESRLSALARMKQYKAIVPVILDVADDVPLADAIDVYDLSLRLGFEKVQFVTPE